MASTSADRAAKYFIGFGRRHDVPIDNLKLQKLLYYAQGMHLAEYGEPLFSDDIEAWVHGPVVASVYGTYKHYGWTEIEEAGLRARDFSESARSVLKAVAKQRARIDGTELERRTHKHKPWIDARGDLAPDEPSREVISRGAIRKYFESLLA